MTNPPMVASIAQAGRTAAFMSRESFREAHHIRKFADQHLVTCGEWAIEVNQPYQRDRRVLGLPPGNLVRVRSVLEIGPTPDARVSLEAVRFEDRYNDRYIRTHRVLRLDERQFDDLRWDSPVAA